MSNQSLPVDVVNHPPHYTAGAVECIDAIHSALGDEGFKAYCRGAVLKYIWRTNLKHPEDRATDLRKAQWYLAELIKQEES